MRLTNILNCVSKLPKNYANFPESYIKDKLTFLESKSPRGRNYQRRINLAKKVIYFDQYKPWSKEFEQLNQKYIDYPKIYLEPLERFFIFKGDRVQILNGKDKGKQGVVNYTVEERNWVYVQNLNLERNHLNQKHDDPGFIKADEAPLLINRDVALIDPEDRLPTTIEWRYDENGKIVRVSKRTERIIPIPSRAFETIDYKFPDAYEEQDKDTSAESVEKVTFKPELKTFEMDIMDQMGIKEERNPFPMFWY